MIVLWIFLSVLAAIFLLLCCPVGLSVSWWYPPKGKEVTQHRAYLTEDVQKEIAKLELCAEDEQILKQMVGELPPRELPPEKELLVKLHFLFLKFTVYPMSKKEKPSKLPKMKKAAQNKSPQKEEKKKSEKTDWKALLLWSVQNAKKSLGMILRDICLKRLELYITVAREDAAKSALDAQKLLTAVYSALGVTQNVMKVKKADIRICPDFRGDGKNDVAVRFCISFHPIVAVAAGLRFLGSLLKKMLRQTKESEKNETSSNAGREENAPAEIG